MAKAFISYSRKDTEFTRRLADCLSEQKYELWVDWESIPPTVDWKSHIQKGVEEADTFLFLISPDSIKSKECGAELEEAVKNGKRLIPLLVREIIADEAPKELKHINWIFFTKEEDFDKSFNKLVEAINTDYEWAQTHRRIQVKALEWERAGKENSFLLRGKDLEFAEGQLVVNASKEPKPTDLQREFILKSRKDAARLRRIRNGLLIGAAAVMFVLMLVALYQRGVAIENEEKANENEKKAQAAKAEAEYNAGIADANAKEAEKNAQIAQIGELSALGITKIGQDYNDALLLSVEAYRRAKELGLNMESAESALLSVLQSRRGLQQILLGHNDWVTGVDYSSDGKMLASSSWDNTTFLWNAADPRNPVLLKKLPGDGVRFVPGKSILATTNSLEGLLKLWDISNPANPFEVSEFAENGWPGEGIIGFASNGNFILTTNRDQDGNSIIEVTDISNPEKPLSLSTIYGSSAAISNNGSLLAVNGWDQEGNPLLSLWDISTPASPALVSSIPTGVLSGPNSIVFSPSNDVIATLNESSVVTLWSLSDPYQPVQLSQLSGYPSGISGIAFSPVAGNLILGGSDGKILVWDVSDRENPASHPSEALDAHSLAVKYYAYDPNASIMVSGANDGMLMLWNPKRMNNSLQIQSPDGELVTASPDGRFLVARDDVADTSQGSLSVWNVSDSSKPVRVSQLSTSAVPVLAAFSPDDRFVLTVGFDPAGQTDKVQLWDLSDPQKPVSHDLNEGTVDEVFFSSASNALVVSSRDDATQDESSTLWDLGKPGAPSKFGLVRGAANGITFSPDGKKLAIGSSNDGKVMVWDLSKTGNYNQLGSLTGVAGHFSPDGNWVAVDTNDQIGKPIVEVWDITDWESRKKLATLDGMDATFSPDGKLLVTEVQDETKENAYNMLVWDIADPANPVSNLLTGHIKEISTVAFRPDSKIFASASEDKTIILWDVSDPRKPKKGMTLNGHSDYVNAVTFNLDGTRLASGGDDKTIILWKVNSFQDAYQIGTLKGSEERIISLGFTGDQRLVSNETIPWDLDPNLWMEKACHLVGSNFSADKWSQLFSNEQYRDTCESFNMVPAPEPEPAAAPESATPTVLSACTDAQETLACPLVQVSEPTFLNRFCVEDVPYTLYAVPVGTTLTPLDDRYKCTDQGVHGGKQQYSCYGPPGFVFPANMCSTSCAIPQSDQCEAGFGLDSTQSCCVPIPSNVDADGCVQVNLEIKSCTAQ